ncbi:uncharacterized protein LOC131032836 isoform X3 [Cryptomeria japonica]|uniref:uncharacterized protein LOC131032836 isoform X3 n=1 Tax=Cryptomeria japonica TaxID=3369 RepID=UPI0027DA137E|nr:uncharacterized protein LOC131032836 isoform X3 [Cryptomeria japonica]
MGASTRVYKFQWLPYPSEEEEDCPAPFLFDAVLEPNKQESEFDKENMEQTLMKEGDVRVIHPSFSCEYAYYYFFINDNVDNYSSKNKKEGGDKVFELDPKNLTCDKNKKQFLLEEEYVELAESVPWKPEQPSAAPLSESHSHLDCFTVVNDAETTPVQENQSIPREKNEVIGASNLWSTKKKYGNLLHTGCMEMNLNPKKTKENQVEMTKQRRILKEILKENSSAEIILEKKNVRCNKKHGVLGEKKRDCSLEVLPPEISAHGSSSAGFNPEDNDFYPSDKENWTSKILCQASKTTTGNICRVDQDTHLLQTDTGRAPFPSLSQNLRVNNRPTRSSSLKNTNRSMDNQQGLHSEVQIPGIVQLPNVADSKKKWHMVVDTGCLIHEESRQALKQLEGIKGTHLIIPRIVIQELDCLKHQNKSKQGIFRWIEQCMINKGWWVHVQRSAESFSVGDGLSHTAEDHILECALLYERLPNGGHVVILSNDVAIKIKAMAEGMLCENAREFCQSLLSPYSERFLWSESTAHDHNWTEINNRNNRKPFGLSRKLTYFVMMRNSLLHHEEPKKKSNEDAKGLKLILLHI